MLSDSRETEMHLLCPVCRGSLKHSENGRLACDVCAASSAAVDEDGIVRFDGCADQHHFFEKQALERLDYHYRTFDDAAFALMLAREALWEMDLANKSVGIARKFWWESHIGKLQGKCIMDFGAGVNYITPYFLKSGNEVVAVDICEESIRYQRKILAQLSVPIDKLTSVVADVEKTEYEEVFDVVNVSNMLHHVADKKAALEKIYRSLKPGGKMIIVEPNYYYPPRWMIETDFLDSINFVKKYFVRNDLIEQDEKAVVFRELVAIIEDAGFRIDFREKDRNYLGYFTVYWMGEGTISARIIYWLDQNILSRLLPRIFAPFEYLIATKR